MNARSLFVSSIVLVSACNTSTTSTSGEQGSSAATSQAAPTSAAPGAAAQPGSQPGAQPGSQPAPSSSTGVSVANQDKKVNATQGPGGSSLNLENDAGKGSVSTSNSGVKVVGKAGAITIPTGVPGLPHK